MTIYFVLLAGTLPLDFAGPLQVFLEARRLGLEYEIRYISSSDQVGCDGGLQLANLSPLPATLMPEDIIVLPGCDQSFSAYATCDAHQVIQWLKKVVAEQTVLTICSGAVLAAKAGLLVNKSCTTHYKLVDKMRVTFPESQVLDNRIFVEDANIISSAGISSGIDMAIYFVSSRFSEHIGTQVAREMLVYFRRTGQDPQLSCWMQYRNHMHRSIHKVQDVVCRDITQYYALEQLAHIANLSPRQLSRLFSVHLGVTPREYLQHIRIGHAKQLLKHSNNSIEVVAQDCGYSSSRQFRRAFAQITGMSPQQYRQQHINI